MYETLVRPTQTEFKESSNKLLHNSGNVEQKSFSGIKEYHNNVLGYQAINNILHDLDWIGLERKLQVSLTRANNWILNDILGPEVPQIKINTKWYAVAKVQYTPSLG